MDPYTEQLLERTRQRREMLNQKLGKTPDPAPRKRMLADNTTQNIPSNAVDDDSPKRQCVRETESAIKPDTPAISSVRSRMNQLSEQRLAWAEGVQNTGEMSVDENYQVQMRRETVAPCQDPQPSNGRKSRLAQLASTINTWEDDLSHPTIKKPEEKKQRWQPPPKPARLTPEEVARSESRERHSSAPKSTKITAAPPPPPVPTSPAYPSPKKYAAPPPPTSPVKVSSVQVQLKKPQQTDTPKQRLQVKQSVDLIPVNAKGLNETVEITEEEPTAKPIADRMATWRKTSDAPQPAKDAPEKQPVSARKANWEQKISLTPTFDKTVSSKVQQTPKQMCTPGAKPLLSNSKPTPFGSSAVKSASKPPSGLRQTTVSVPPQPNFDEDNVEETAPALECDPASRPVSARMAGWQEKDQKANPPKESEPTAYSVLARMSAWENISSSNQVSYIKKVDPDSSPKQSPTRTTLKPSGTPTKPQVLTPKKSFKESIQEKAVQMRSTQNSSTKPTSQPLKPEASPAKMGTSFRPTSSPAKSGVALKPSSSPGRGETTPAKSPSHSPVRVGSATKQMQQRLMEKVQHSKTDALAEKMRRERMAEVDALNTRRWQNGLLREETTTTDDEGGRIDEGPPALKTAPTGPAFRSEGKREVIKAKARADFENKLAAMGFDISEEHAAYTFNKNGRGHSQEQDQPINDENGGPSTNQQSDMPPPAPPLPPSQANHRPQNNSSGNQVRPKSSIYRLVSKKSNDEDRPMVRQQSMKKVTFQGRTSSTEESDSGTEPTIETSDELDEETDDFEPESEDNLDETAESDLSSRPDDSYESSNTSMEQGKPSEKKAQQSQSQPRSVMVEDEGDDVSLSAFVPASVRRESILPPVQQEAYPSSDDGMDYKQQDTRKQHRSGPQLQVDQSTDESDEDAPVGEIDDLLDEAMDDTVDLGRAPVRTEPQPQPIPRKRRSHMMATTGQCELSLPGSSTVDRDNLAYSISMYRSNRDDKPPMTKARITRNSHYTQEEVKEEDIQMPQQLPPEVQRKTIRERIQELYELVSQEQSVIMQTSNALNQCCSGSSQFAGSAEQVECNRLLLVACQRRQSYLTEIQRLKETGELEPPGRGPRGSLTITDIRLPLKKDFVTKIGTASDNTVHYFIILIRNGPQVIVTQMLSTHDPMMRGSLDFPNLVKIHGICGDFKLTLEIYSMSVSRESLGKEKKRKTPKKHAKSTLPVESPGGPTAVRTTSFTLITTLPITMKLLDKNCFTLERIPFLSPLHGSIYMKLKCMMEQHVEERGFLTMFEDVSGFGAWHRRWTVLAGNKLCFWKYPDDETRKDAICYVDLKRCITEKVGLIPRDICARPNTFELVSVRPPRKGEPDTLVTKTYNTMTTTKHMLSADTKEERIVWCNKINRALANIRTWHADAMRPVKPGKK